MIVDGPLFLRTREHLGKAVRANNVDKLQSIERSILYRLADAREMGWPELAASWEADLQLVRQHINQLKG